MPAWADDAYFDPEQEWRIPSQAPNSPPLIIGTPPATVPLGQAYSFRPFASDVDGDPLTFWATNLPPWLSVNGSTGALYGVPSAAHVGSHGAIYLLVSDGRASARLGPFSISVVQGSTGTYGQGPTGGSVPTTPWSPPVTTGSVTLNWQPPTRREDGSPLSNLAGYRVYGGRTPQAMTLRGELRNPGLTRFVVQNLEAGDWWFSMTAYDASGLESDRATPVLKTVR